MRSNIISGNDLNGIKLYHDVKGKRVYFDKYGYLLNNERSYYPLFTEILKDTKYLKESKIKIKTIHATIDKELEIEIPIKYFDYEKIEENVFEGRAWYKLKYYGLEIIIFSENEELPKMEDLPEFLK